MDGMIHCGSTARQGFVHEPSARIAAPVRASKRDDFARVSRFKRGFHALHHGRIAAGERGHQLNARAFAGRNHGFAIRNRCRERLFTQNMLARACRKFRQFPMPDIFTADNNGIQIRRGNNAS